MNPLPLRIIPLGGLGEIGKNMLCVEYGDDIVVIDAGLMFPKADMHGVDLVLPDTSYLIENADRVRAVLVTHGHEDHTGALPYLLRNLDVPVYAPPLARDLIEVKLRDRAGMERYDLREADAGDRLQFGAIEAEYFRVCHSIPDACGIALRTPAGLVVHTGDFKIDHTPVDGRPTDLQRLAELSREGVLLLLSDSTYAEMAGYTPSENVVATALDHVIADAEGRVLVTTFASLIARVQQVVDAAVKHGRKVAPVGRSMIQNVNMAVAKGYVTAPSGTIMDLQQLSMLDDDEQVIVLTGSQGEPLSVLTRVANHAHRDIEIRPGDTVVISATAIPGQRDGDRLRYRQPDAAGSNRADPAHRARRPRPRPREPGRAQTDAQAREASLFRADPREYRMLVAHAGLAAQTGVAPDDIFVLEDGDVLEIDAGGAEVVDQVPAGHVYVDGLRLWDVGNAVLRDRRALSRDGFIVVVVPLDRASGRVQGEPEIVSSGFIMPEESGDLMERAVALVLETLRDPKNLDDDYVSGRVRGALGRFLYEETRRRPMIVTLPLEV